MMKKEKGGAKPSLIERHPLVKEHHPTRKGTKTSRGHTLNQIKGKKKVKGHTSPAIGVLLQYCT